MSKLTCPINLGGKEYVLTAPTFADFQSLRTYCKYRKYHSLKEEAKEFPDLESMLPEVLKECYQLPEVTMIDLNNFLNLPDVLTEFAYISLRHYHQTISKDEVKSLLTIPAMNEIGVKLQELSGCPKTTEDDDAKNQPGRDKEEK